MAETTEVAEKAVETAHESKRIALLIAALAVVLALTEVAGDDAKVDAQLHAVESANLWAFFQARTIRQTVLAAQAERAAFDATQATDPAARATLEQMAARWQAQIAAWESEPGNREGRRELAERAREAERARARSLVEDGRYDFAASAIQVGIVLASASIITGIIALAWGGAALGLLGALVSIATYLGLA